MLFVFAKSSIVGLMITKMMTSAHNMRESQMTYSPMQGTFFLRLFFRKFLRFLRYFHFYVSYDPNSFSHRQRWVWRMFSICETYLLDDFSLSWRALQHKLFEKMRQIQKAELPQNLVENVILRVFFTFPSIFSLLRVV